MTIHELLNKVHAERKEIPTGQLLEWKTFPPHETDLLVSPDGGLVVAINRVSGAFAAQRELFIVTGHVDTELLEAEVSVLARNS